MSYIITIYAIGTLECMLSTGYSCTINQKTIKHTNMEQLNTSGIFSANGQPIFNCVPTHTLG